MLGQQLMFFTSMLSNMIFLLIDMLKCSRMTYLDLKLTYIFSLNPGISNLLPPLEWIADYGLANKFPNYSVKSNHIQTFAPRSTVALSIQNSARVTHSPLRQLCIYINICLCIDVSVGVFFCNLHSVRYWRFHNKSRVKYTHDSRAKCSSC